MVVAAAVAVAAVGATAYSASKQSSAAKKAANAQAQAAQNDLQLQKQMYDQNRADLAPWRNAGGAALQEISDLYGLGLNNTDTTLVGGDGATSASGPGTSDAYTRQQQAMGRFTASPSYSFRLTEGLKALDKTAAARGKLVSGDQLKAAQGYGQDLASTEYDNYVNRLSSLAGVGQTASNSTVNAGLNYAAQGGQAIQDAGAARASGYIGSANAVSQGVQNGIGVLGMAYGGYGGGNLSSNPSRNVMIGGPAAIVRAP